MHRSSDIHRAVSKTATMMRMAAIAAALLGALSPAAQAQNGQAQGGAPTGPVLSATPSEPASAEARNAVARAARICLSKAEQKAAISNGQAVTLAQAIRSARGSVRGRGAREVVNARLCRDDEKGLVYLLTVLARDGKVTHMAVDAGSGKVVEAR